MPIPEPSSIDSKLQAKLGIWGCNIVPGQKIGISDQFLLDSPGDTRNWWEQTLKKSPSGWAQFSGVNVIVDAGTPLAVPKGILLTAELCDAEMSYHLRQSESGWVATTMCRQEDPHSCLEIHSLCGRAGLVDLEYEVEWAGTPLRRVAYRLADIEIIDPSESL